MPTGAGVPPSNWWQRASQVQTYAVIAVSALLLFLLLAGCDLLLKRYPGAYVLTLSANAAVSLLFGALLGKTIRETQKRYYVVCQRLEMIAEMNHHIRNALELIQLSAHTTHNAQLIANIDAAAGRIQWALREILPQTTSVTPETGNGRVPGELLESPSRTMDGPRRPARPEGSRTPPGRV
jgi:hypothetical protein